MKLVLLVCAALLMSCSSQGCPKTISVDVISSANLTLPVVSRVYLTTNRTNVNWINGSNDEELSTDSIYVVQPENGLFQSFVLSGSAINYTISLTFVESQISCMNVTLSQSFLSDQTLDFSCVPVSSCSNRIDEQITSIDWRKTYDADSDDDYNEYQQLYTGSFRSSIQPTCSGTIANNADSILIMDSNSVTNSTLTLSAVSIRSAGYYIAVGIWNSSNPQSSTPRILERFTLSYGPVLVNPSADAGSLKVLHDTVNYTGLTCVFRSFPNAVVTWMQGDNELTGGGNYAFRSVSHCANNVDTNETFDFTYSISGELMIRQVQYENAAMYYCVANNGFSSLNATRRLRVRDPLRPLWPILGIIASFIITFVFIVSGYIVDKIRGTKDEKLTEDEIDKVFRPSSVISFNDDDLKGLYRRGSSTKEIEVIST